MQPTSLVTIHLPHLDEPLHLIAPASVNDLFIKGMVERASASAGKDVPKLVASLAQEGFGKFDQRITVRVRGGAAGQTDGEG